jgi:1,4-alpha-glucan branching enzyme
MPSFAPTIGDVDLHLFNEGTHRRLWDILGAHPRTIDGVDGVAFAVWAPNADRVSVVGEFCTWDGDRHVMRPLGTSGIHELFVPGVEARALYKYEIRTREGHLLLKADPMAQAAELPPGQASRATPRTRAPRCTPTRCTSAPGGACPSRATAGSPTANWRRGSWSTPNATGSRTSN